MALPIIGKEEDVEGCVAAPVLLQEIIRSCSEKEPLKKPVMTMLQILAELAQYTVQKQDPALNIIALRLGLFPMPNDQLKKALDQELKRLRVMQADAKSASKEMSDGEQKVEA